MINIPSGKTYYSFADMAKDLGIKPFSKQTSDKAKLESQRQRFLGKCPYCQQPLKYIQNTNVMVCENEKCSGKKREFTRKDGEKVVKYEPFTKVLDGESAVIAEVLFDERG